MDEHFRTYQKLTPIGHKNKSPFLARGFIIGLLAAGLLIVLFKGGIYLTKTIYHLVLNYWVWILVAIGILMFLKIKYSTKAVPITNGNEQRK